MMNEHIETIAEMVTKDSKDVLSLIAASIKDGGTITRYETEITFLFYDGSTVTIPDTVYLTKPFTYDNV